MMRVFLDKANVNMKMLTFIGRAFPKLGESMALLENPEALHEAVHGMVAMLQKGLDLDHERGIAGENICVSPDLTTAGQESAESLPSGSDGYGEVDTDGSVDSGISGGLLGTEVASESVDL